MPPEELLSRYPVFENVVSSLWKDQKVNKVFEKSDVVFSSNSRGRGLIGFVDDMAEVFQRGVDLCMSNDIETNEVLSLQAFQQLLDKRFERLLNMSPDIDEFLYTEPCGVVRKHYVPAEFRSENAKRDASLNCDHHDITLSTLAVELRRTLSILSLSLSHKIQLLHWLSIQFLSTSFAQQESVRLRELEFEREREKEKDKSSKMKDADIDLLRWLPIEMLVDNVDDPEHDVEVVLGDDVDPLVDDAQESAKKRKSSILSAEPSSAKKVKIESLPVDQGCPVNALELILLATQHNCMGHDRFGNVYYSFPLLDALSPVLFREVRSSTCFASESLSLPFPDGPVWECISDIKDISRLCSWLCEKGEQECQLLKQVLLWTTRIKVDVSYPAPAVDDSKPTSDAADITNTTKEPIISNLRSRRSQSSNSVEHPASDVAYGEVETLRKRYTSMVKRKRTNRNQRSYDYEVISLCRETQFRFVLDRDNSLFSAKTLLLLKEKYLAAKQLNFLPSVQSISSDVSHYTFAMIAVDFSGADKQLGMGVKGCRERDLVDSKSSEVQFGIGTGDSKIPEWEAVIATSFRSTQSLAYLGGARVGDRIILANNVRIDNVQVMKSTLNDFLEQCSTAVSSEQDMTSLKLKQTMTLLVMRRIDDPINDYHFKKLYDSDVEIQRAHRNHQQHSLLETANDCWSNKFGDHLRPLSRLLVSVFALCVTLDHSALMSSNWRKKTFPNFVYNLYVLASKNESTVALCQQISRFLLDLELYLTRSAVVPLSLWLEPGNDIRKEWRAYCGEQTSPALSPERLSVACALLRASLDTELIQGLVYPAGVTANLTALVPKTIFGGQSMEQMIYAILSTNPSLALGTTVSPNLLQKYSRAWTTILREQASVIYFAEGHRESEQENERFFTRFVGTDIERRRGVLWGQTIHSENCKYLPLPAQGVWVGTVKCVRIFNSLVPFAQVTIILKSAQSLGKALTCPAPPSMWVNSDGQRESLSRSLHRIVVLIKRTQGAQCKAFCEAVDLQEFPDYLSVVQSPMDLTKIEEKIVDRKYSSTDEFLADFHLIFNNCVAFNGVDDKRLVPIAASILQHATVFVQEMIQQCLPTTPANVRCFSFWLSVFRFVLRHFSNFSFQMGVETIHQQPTVSFRTVTLCVRIDTDLPLFLLPLEVILKKTQSFYDQGPVLNRTVVSMSLSADFSGQVSNRVAKVGTDFCAVIVCPAC
jgi:hypothetical protein